MKTSRALLALALAASPFIVQAQTANTPGGSAATGTPLDQTKGTPSKMAPSTTSTTPTTTNPSGSLDKGSTSTMDTDKKMKKPSTATTTAPGDSSSSPNVPKETAPTK